MSVAGERREEKLNYLSTIEIFRDLSQREIEEIDRQIAMSTCPAGNIFYVPEESGEVLFLLKKGTVQLYRLTPEGKKIVVATLNQGAVFGEMSLVGQGMHNTFAEAVEPCKLCVMSRQDVERLMLEKPRVAFRLVEALGERLVRIEQQVEDVAFKPIATRLAHLLLQLAEKSETNEIVGYTHQDFAEMLGTYRETVTQTLKDLKLQGLVEIGRKRLQLVDVPGLRRLAEE